MRISYFIHESKRAGFEESKKKFMEFEFEKSMILFLSRRCQKHIMKSYIPR